VNAGLFYANMAALMDDLLGDEAFWCPDCGEPREVCRCPVVGDPTPEQMAAGEVSREEYMLRWSAEVASEIIEMNAAQTTDTAPEPKEVVPGNTTVTTAPTT
jgi:hypothetical protein